MLERLPHPSLFRKTDLVADTAKPFLDDRVAAFGDNLNDVEMLDYAGTAYIMGNAIESLKSRGYRQAATNDEGGLAHAVTACLRDQ